MKKLKKIKNGKIKYDRGEFQFVSEENTQQMINDGFEGIFYGRNTESDIWEDPILYGSGCALPLSGFAKGTKVLCTIQQYEEFYKLNK